MTSGLLIRPARTSDVAAIRALCQPLIDERILVPKDHVNYFENIQEFMVVTDTGGTLAGCAALHVFWEDLAEVRTVATSAQFRRRGVGRALIESLLQRAKDLGVDRVFCLTFERDFFTSLGFEQITGTPVSPEVFAELLRSQDEGTAEFLDLARVKPNTLGNYRMMISLGQAENT
ncbi:amino-acid N-acetyltransferase [uncultured Brevibacterium sp.]|uniref:amino-acid N-acetyltransferase n=1 Tax=uncultured Brevibacterium sp. TaxID=189678 RepID=UPI0025DEAA93|nr:amino-acid N-acetyltransferase [uncultured Brevibacterium sp.]